MPAGCDFVCKNEECEHTGKGLVVTGAWPMGDINKIMDAPNVAKNEVFREGLIRLKANGRKYACITYPNVDEIGTEGYRVHRWCPNCPCLWTYDALVEDENETIEETIANAKVPDICPSCQTKLMDFNDLVDEEGVIACPTCQKEMQKSTWFSNETTEEER